MPVAISRFMKKCVCYRNPEGFKTELCGWEVNWQILSVQCKAVLM